jgi:heterodisulfide reductase subunit C
MTDNSNLSDQKQASIPHPVENDKCTGCGVCTLPCPVWRQTTDLLLTQAGRGRALQSGASARDLAESLRACILCGACGSVCPAQVDTVALILKLREALCESGQPLFGEVGTSPVQAGPAAGTAADPRGKRVLLASRELQSAPGLLRRVAELLGGPGGPCIVDGQWCELSDAIEAGRASGGPLSRELRARLPEPGALIACDGLLHRYLRQWFPGARVCGLGEALLDVPGVRAGLKPSDMLVLDTRSFFADYPRLVKLYCDLRDEVHCFLNFGLQRTAIPTGTASLQHRAGGSRVDPASQVRWILEGFPVLRVVVENPYDIGVFRTACDLPVLHLSELAP